LWNDFSFSAPQLKRDPLGGAQDFAVHLVMPIEDSSLARLMAAAPSS